jgi:hypothetical protein
MLKKYVFIGVACFSLMVLLPTHQAAALCLGNLCYTGGNWKASSLVFTSTWFSKNTKVWPAVYEVIVCPTDVTVFFKNPDGQTGGKPSDNFLESDIDPVALTSSRFALGESNH